MKKLFIILVLLMVSVSLFSQDVGGEDGDGRRIEAKGMKKNVARFHIENLLVFQRTGGTGSWADGTWDYSLTGVGFSYSRLFNDFIGINLVIGGLFAGLEDPFDQTIDRTNTWTQNSYPFDINRTGYFFKIGPYFRIGRIGIAPSLAFASVLAGDPVNDNVPWTDLDQFSGISCSVELLITDSFLVFIEGGVMSGFRFNAGTFWQALLISSNSEENTTFLYQLYNQENNSLIGCSLTVGVGLAF